MSKFIKTIASFLGAVPLLMSKGMASTPAEFSALDILDEPSAVQLRPLNSDTANLFAGHRSHSSHASHASHASHYSGAGSSTYSAPYVPPPPPPPPSTYKAPSESTYSSTPSSNVDSSLPAPSTKPTQSTSSKLTLQIMRVQIALTSRKYFDGNIDGVMTASTRKAIEEFQVATGLPKSGQMTTPTLNALGVPAVN